MTRRRTLVFITALLLLEVLPLAIAHGDENSHGVIGSGETMSEPEGQEGTEWAVNESYFRHPEHSRLIWAHIIFMVLSWAIFLPIAVILSIARSRWAVLHQILFLVANAIGLFVGIAYNAQTPDLYENNAHHKIGWIATWMATSWIIFAVIRLFSHRLKKSGTRRSSGQAVSAAAMAQYNRLQRSDDEVAARWSGDSGQGTERNSASLFSPSERSPSLASEHQTIDFAQHHYGHEDADGDYDAEAEKRGFLSNNAVDRFLSRKLQRFPLGRRAWNILAIFYVILERTLILMGFVSVTSGAVTYSGIARGDAVFNILAHFIKGGVFFWYGLITLGRWTGTFADFGWAWNIKPPGSLVGRWKSTMPSAEFTESFMMFLYGASNVFLEHMAAWGGEWVAQDLEHVSISILFFGGGLLGMLVESNRIRDLLNTSITSESNPSIDADTADSQWEMPKHYSTSLNPLPALIIFLLGVMMGSHHQASIVSTMIHKQWGTMFVGSALARAVTYLLLYLSPPKSYLPARPPTEIVASFCLVGGGLVFMLSNKDTVSALEVNGLDAMFVFTVAMGLTALIMAWTTVLVAVKGWAVRRTKGLRWG